jgi:hypothetical protein
MSIICVLNTFVRPFTFEQQLSAVMNQTIPPKKVIVWDNNSGIDFTTYKTDKRIIVISSSMNFGVWGRFFSLYYLLDSEYVCVFDDDTIPGNRWFENCINTICKYNALLGTIGVYFKKGCAYDITKRYGWDGVSNDSKIVDIVGHSWFLKKEWISVIIKELPSIDKQFLTCGEDMHLSYTLNKYLNILTVVPPHPENDTSLWGSQYDTACSYGNINSTYVNTGKEKFDEVILHYINKGFETIQNKAEHIKKYNNCLDYYLNKIKNGQNFSLSRFADGEYYVLVNNTLTNIDNWTFESGSILCNHLNESLKIMNTNYYYGVSGLSDDESTCNFYYSSIINHHNITYANIFVNQNYKKWLSFLNEYDNNCVLISSSTPKNGKIGKVNIIETILIDAFLVNIWDSKYEEYFQIMNNLGKKYTNMLFLISAGPLSCVFIKKLYESNPNNIYIDVGSSIDIFTKNCITRDYQHHNDMSNDVKDLPIII